MTIGVVIGAWLVVLAAASDTDLGPYAQFANYGILGLLALGFFRGAIVSNKHYEEMRQDRDQARGELVSLRTKMDDQIIPLLTRVFDVIARASDQRRIGNE